MIIPIYEPLIHATNPRLVKFLYTKNSTDLAVSTDTASQTS